MPVAKQSALINKHPCRGVNRTPCPYRRWLKRSRGRICWSCRQELTPQKITKNEKRRTRYATLTNPRRELIELAKAAGIIDAR